jgi:hypothetical protein
VYLSDASAAAEHTHVWVVSVARATCVNNYLRRSDREHANYK